jgi:hypothetical protein
LPIRRSHRKQNSEQLGLQCSRKRKREIAKKKKKRIIIIIIVFSSRTWRNTFPLSLSLSIFLV